MKLRKSCSHQMTALTLKMVFQNILASKGPNSDMTNKSPIEYFHLMIPDTFAGTVIVEQTNLYADQFFQSSNVPTPISSSAVGQ